MKYLTILSALFILNCGDIGKMKEIPFNADKYETEPPTQVTEEEPTIRTTAYNFYVTPTQLMFYYSEAHDRPYDPQSIIITNNTYSTIVISRAFIQSAPESLWAGGAEYFKLQEQEFPVVLYSGDTLELKVRFITSVSQRNANLIIYTTYQSITEFNIRLSGKVFF